MVTPSKAQVLKQCKELLNHVVDNHQSPQEYLAGILNIIAICKKNNLELLLGILNFNYILTELPAKDLERLLEVWNNPTFLQQIGKHWNIVPLGNKAPGNYRHMQKRTWYLPTVNADETSQINRSLKELKKVGTFSMFKTLKVRLAVNATFDVSQAICLAMTNELPLLEATFTPNQKISSSSTGERQHVNGCVIAFDKPDYVIALRLYFAMLMGKVPFISSLYTTTATPTEVMTNLMVRLLISGFVNDTKDVWLIDSNLDSQYTANKEYSWH